MTATACEAIAEVARSTRKAWLSVVVVLAAGLVVWLAAWLWWLASERLAAPVLPGGVRATAAPAAVHPEAGHAAAEPRDVTPPAADRSRAVEPPPAPTVEVVVCDCLAEPVAGATVAATGMRGEVVRRFTSDVEGIVRVPETVVARSRAVRAWHDEVGRSVAVDLRTLAPGDATPRLVLARPVFVTGLALGSDGLPEAFAKVRVDVDPSMDLRRGAWLSTDEVRADVHGRFSFEAAAGLACRLHLPQADHPDAWRGIEEPITTFVAGSDEQLVVARDGAFAVAAKFVDAAGNEVTATPHAIGVAPPRLVGSLLLGDWLVPSSEITLPGPGRYRVSALGGGIAGEVEVEVSGAAPRAAVVVPVREAGPLAHGLGPEWQLREIEVAVVDANGRRFVDAVPALCRMPPDATRWNPKVERSENGHTMTVAVLRGDTRLVIAEHGGHYGSVEVVGGRLPERVEVRLQPSVSLTVRVSCSGRPARGLTLRIVHPWGPQDVRVPVAALGQADFASVPVGSWDLQVLRGPEVVETRRVHLTTGVRAELAIAVVP